jgi:uncharacterized NAD(P)/FAD-binding protein YdhS
MNSFKNDVLDITFIGSGIATSFTIIKLLDELNKLNTSSILKINIIDKYPEFFCGIPYGKRSGNSVLLINSLQNFLPEPQRSSFIKWLRGNKKALIDKFLASGGEESKLWVFNNAKEIEADNWKNLYIPRSFFGIYIAKKVKKSLGIAEQRGQVQIKYTISEVIDLQKVNGVFEIKLDSAENLQSKKVVLSLGSLPTKRIHSQELLVKENDFLLINDIYKKDLESNFKEIENFVLRRKTKETNALIIGANATGLETIYRLNDSKRILNSITNYTLLSIKGTIPDSDVNESLKKKFSPKHLLNLQNKGEITAKEIVEATFLDLDNANKIGLGAAATVDVISITFVPLLKKLNKKEQEIFACKYGNEIGRRQRCSGKHYTNVVSKSLRSKKLVHLAGKFTNIKKEKNAGYRFEYIDTKTKKNKNFPKDMHLVINCTGSMNLENINIPSLIKNIVRKQYCVPNNSKIGFKVNNNFEASENLFVAGPLLAGNVIEESPLWHLEHCGRIIYTSSLIAKYLV